MNEFEGVIGKIGKCNAKDIPTPNSSHTESDISKALIELANQFNNIQNSLIPTNNSHSSTNNRHSSNKHKERKSSLRDTLTTTTHLPIQSIDNLLARIHKACSSTHDKTAYYTNVDNVLHVKKLTQSMVISPLDKADSTLVVM
jgi:hypothetical protein